MTPLNLFRLPPFRNRTSGKREVTIGLLDGPVMMTHPELTKKYLREVSGNGSGACTQASSTACLHGTFVAGILSAKRGAPAPAICPNCTLLVRPIFAETNVTNGEMPSAMPEELAQAILDCIDAGARVLKVGAAVAHPSIKSDRASDDALDQDARSGLVVIVAGRCS